MCSSIQKRNCLQFYALSYDSHSTKTSDQKKIIRKNLVQNGRRYSENVQAKKVKDLQRHKNGLNMPFKF